MPTPEADQDIRRAAFRHLASLNHGGAPIHWNELQYGFEYGTQRISYVEVGGIRKPRQMPYVLSLRTGPGKAAEQYEGHRRTVLSVLSGAQHLQYDFKSGGPDLAQNRYLTDAFRNNIPLIYFLSAGQGSYIWAAPAYISAADKLSETCQLVFGSPDRGLHYELPGEAEREHGMSMLRDRITRYLPIAEYRQSEPTLRLVAEDPPDRT